ncbi:MAG: RsmE family RNA methyltransferase [Candidatus Vogelbacteria bacterium]|nr:RsmE family RNA methyltransferase [Candidatus Vogelbacteria bacterium]
MKKHRFFLKENLTGPKINSQDQELINQLLNVLRLKTGDTVFLFDGLGDEILAEITSLNRQLVIFHKIEKVVKTISKKRTVVLYCAILKKENFEIVVQKATEIGVQAIVPIITDRTVKFGLKGDRLTKIIKEASEQSGRTIEAKLEKTLKFAEAVNKASTSNEINLIFDQSGKKIGKLKSGRIGIFVGPEGGWTKDELALAQKAGLAVGLLGDLTLRAETAGIVASFEAVNNL